MTTKPDTPVADLTNYELDRAAAVEVMGLHYWTAPAPKHTGHWCDETGQVIFNEPFSPSTSPTDADMVIGKIIERFGGEWSFYGDKDGWEVTHGRRGKFNKNRNRAVCEIAVQTVREGE